MSGLLLPQTCLFPGCCPSVLLAQPALGAYTAPPPRSMGQGAAPLLELGSCRVPWGAPECWVEGTRQVLAMGRLWGSNAGDGALLSPPVWGARWGVGVHVGVLSSPPPPAAQLCPATRAVNSSVWGSHVCPFQEPGRPVGPPPQPWGDTGWYQPPPCLGASVPWLGVMGLFGAWGPPYTCECGHRVLWGFGEGRMGLVGAHWGCRGGGALRLGGCWGWTPGA